MARPTFNVGDRVRSAADSSDTRTMHGIWHAEVVSVIPFPKVPGGYAYQTLGTWETLPGWSLPTPDPTPTVRQLWAQHLELETD